MDLKSKIKNLKNLILNSDNIVAFTGAGISTNSGLSDFRSPNKGIGKDIDFVKMLSIDYLSKNPKEFYENYCKYFLFKDANANEAHLVLAKLEQKGKLKAVITQNIDGLHQKGGSKNVVELHGNQRDYYCMSCNGKYVSEILNKNKTPKCIKCDGIVRPDIVFYGERINAHSIEEAIRFISKSDLLLVLGSSLTVYPACDLLRYARGKIVIINNEATQYDMDADLVINEDISKTLMKIV